MEKDNTVEIAGSTGKFTTALVLAWLVPGAGHWFLGDRKRGILFCLIILAAVLIGCSLHGNLYRVLPDQPLTIVATLASMGMGIPYFAARYLFEFHGDVTQIGYEYGTAFLLTAGLMNLLLVLDVWDVLRGEKSL